MTILPLRHMLLLASLCLPMTLTACEQTTTTDNGGLPIFKDSVIAVPLSGLIPAKIGNYWVYTDSSGTSNDTVRIISKDTLRGFTFWTVKGYLFGIGEEFAIRNDSIFVKQYSDIGTTIITCVFIPPPDSSKRFRFLIGGDAGGYRNAVTVRKPITLPVGTFSWYVAYVWDGGLERDSIVFVPGIGIVSRTFVGLPYPGRTGFTVRYELKAYSVGIEGTMTTQNIHRHFIGSTGLLNSHPSTRHPRIKGVPAKKRGG